jgi:hypothetical protein
VSTASDICAPLRSGSWSPGGAAAFSTGFSDPGGSVADIVSWALEYVAPLNEWVDQLVGNEGQVSSFAATWRGVASDLAGYEADLSASATRIGELEGKTARALRKRHDDIEAVLADASEWSSATAASLELASTIVGAVHDAAVGALSELAGLITSLFGFTLNPFDKIDQLKQLGQRALGFIEVVGDLIERMFDALARLVELLRSLVPLIEEALLILREAIGEGMRASSPLFGGALDDLLSRDPRVSEYVPGDLDSEQQKALDRINSATEIDSLADLIANNGSVDVLGGKDRSVVDITEILAEDGSTHYIVALPSTQDWGIIKGLMNKEQWDDMLKDYPATNDLDSNIALMVMDNPWLATQYERAVMQAMSDAGVPDGAEVVYTGFSQGGIMAGNLASSTDSPYKTIGVVTNGAPLGTFPIDPNIPVIAFEHLGDPVPVLDGQLVDPQNILPNRSTVVLPTPGGDLSMDSTHNNGNYVDSVTRWEEQMATSGQSLPDFFQGTIVDRQQHTWTE